ncbi:WhiB family transcriptional regulator [Streptomyces nigrescens]
MRFRTNSLAPNRTLRRLGDQSWHDHAACTGMTPADSDATFHPGSRDMPAITRAKRICGGCPMRRICLDAALESDNRYGIRGGLTEDERKPLHDRLDHRLDSDRVVAILNGIDVHVSKAERKAVARMAYTSGVTAERLAYILKLDDVEYATRLLREARNELEDRDRYWDTPDAPCSRNDEDRNRYWSTPHTPYDNEDPDASVLSDPGPVDDSATATATAFAFTDHQNLGEAA